MVEHPYANVPDDFRPTAGPRASRGATTKLKVVSEATAEPDLPDDDGGGSEDDEINYRLACLEHATECFVADSDKAGDVVALAKRMYDFVKER